MEHTSGQDNITPQAAFLTNLRSRTAALHQQLEDLPLSKSLMREDVTLEDYARYLVYMRDVMTFFDTQILSRLQHIIPEPVKRKKTDQIDRDLEFLKHKDIAVEGPASSAMPDIHDDATAMGIAYVIEGSTLGGRVIMKHITAKLPIEEEAGGQFFAGYKIETGPMWKQFLTALQDYTVAGNHEEAVIQGAMNGFSMIAQHFQQH